MEWFPFLLLLACPLMMIFMMFGHGHKHGVNHANHDDHHSKVFDLKVENLEIENEKLRNELDELKSIVKKES